jgi:anti-sigma factor RsiW
MVDSKDKLAGADGAGRACDCADVAAYLDGELRAAESESFEAHVKSCPPCAAALTEQRRLLGLLDAALSGSHKQVELPRDFTRVVAARAQSDMASVRRRPERLRAALLAAGLAFVSLALLGREPLVAALSAARPAARAANSVAGLTLRSAGEATAAAAVFTRGLGGYFVHSAPSGAILLLGAALAVAALLILVGLISRYHRSGLPD